jgi:hypothetical protein
MRVPRSEVQIRGMHISDENIEVTRNERILLRIDLKPHLYILTHILGVVTF